MDVRVHGGAAATATTGEAGATLKHGMAASGPTHVLRLPCSAGSAHTQCVSLDATLCDSADACMLHNAQRHLFMTTSKCHQVLQWRVHNSRHDSR